MQIRQQSDNKSKESVSLGMLTERDKVNLQKLLQLYNFTELQPPPEIFQNMQECEYFVDAGNDKKKRFIFYKVPYLPHEEDKIMEIKSKMIDYGIYEKYPEQIILKHLYAAEFNSKTCLERLKKLQQFQNNPVVTTLSKETINKLKLGCIYSYGHDRSMKPIVIIRADRFNYSLSIDENYNPVYFLMLVVLGYKNVPYHAQKYINIFDLCDMKMTEIPYAYLYEVFTAMNLYYCGNTMKTYIFNAKGIGSLWTFAKTFIPEAARKKIIFINEQNKGDILQQIDPNELEQKYGGNLDNLKEYWPPKCTDEQFNAIQSLKKKQRELETDSEFYSVCNDTSYFEEKTEISCRPSCGNCAIF